MKNIQEIKEKYFIERTLYHISLVGKYIDRIIELTKEDNNKYNINISILKKEKIEHDLSKFQEPEREPYIEINWDYYMKQKGKKIEKTGYYKNLFKNEATIHHIISNKHHPEYWDENFDTEKGLNQNNRDGVPEYMTDATTMPLEYVSEMVADWCAVSEERGTDPKEWADKNINKRWKFTDKQIEYIYYLIDNIWEGEYTPFEF